MNGPTSSRCPSPASSRAMKMTRAALLRRLAAMERNKLKEEEKEPPDLVVVDRIGDAAADYSERFATDL